MFAFIQRLFGATKHTAEAVVKPEVARAVVTEFNSVTPEKRPAAKKRAGRARKASK